MKYTMLKGTFTVTHLYEFNLHHVHSQSCFIIFTKTYIQITKTVPHKQLTIHGLVIQ